MMKLQALLVLTTTTVVLGQRGSFAGSRPIGYPDISPPSTAPAADTLGNRFGDGQSTPSTTTQRLPIEANGDRDLVDRLSKLPQDKQPFWFINWKAIEEQRRNPQTYPQKPNDFAPLPFAPANNFQGGSSFGNANTASTDSSFATESTTKKSNSGTRDVDVSAFLDNKNGLLGVSDADNSKPIRDYPTKPNQDSNKFVNMNQHVQNQENGQSVSGNRNAQSTLSQGSPIFDPEYPGIPTYPILHHNTRDPEAYFPTNYNRDRSMLANNRFRDYDFEEEGPVFVPYGYMRPNRRPLYYFK